MSIIQQIENHLGPVDQGWKDNDADTNLQIISVRDCPEETVSTFLSLGMSNHVLEMTNSRKVRQELVFSTYTLSISNLITSFLMSLCEAILSRGQAVLRGEVIPLSSSLAQRLGFDFIYCTIPIFFDDDFSSYDETSPSTVMVWVVPIHRKEAEFIEYNGWELFEDLLEEKDPDLYSLVRESIVR